MREAIVGAPPAQNPAVTRAGWPERLFAQALALVGLACGAVAILVARPGGFTTDDVANLGEAHDRGLTLGFLFDPIVGERLAPGHRLLDWLVVGWTGHEWLAGLLLTATFLVATVVLTGYVVREITGSAAIGLAVAVLMGTWAGWMRVALWWASSAHLLPGTAFSLATLLAVLVWDRDRRARWLVAAGVLLLGAHAFSPRAAIVAPIAFVLLVLGRPAQERISWTGVRRRLRAAAPMLLVVFGVAIAATVVDLLAGDASRPLESDLGRWGSFAWRWLVTGDGPLGLNGAPRTSFTATGIAGFLLLVGGAAATIKGARSALIWAGIVLILLLCAAQVGVSRLSQFNVAVLADLRYHEGDVLTLAVLVPCAWTAAGRPLPRQRRVGLALAAAFAVAWLVVGAVTVHDVRARDGGPASSDYVANLRRTLPAATAGRTATIVNAGPPAILAATGANGLAKIVRLFVPNASVTFHDATEPPILVWSDGVAHPLTLEGAINAPLTTRTCLDTTPASRYLARGSGGLAVLRLPEASAAWPVRLLTIRLDATTRAGPLGVAYSPLLPGTPNLVVLPVRPGTEALRIDIPGTATHVAIGAWGGLRSCITAVLVRRARFSD